MICYFSGIGNTRYATENISGIIKEELCFIPEIKTESLVFSGESLGFLFPIYSWGVPPIVLDFIAALPEEFIRTVRENKIPVWMVCTCGDETGRAPDMLNKALLHRGLELKGAWSVIMPNTYVLLPGFDIDSKEVEKEKLRNADIRIAEIGEMINNAKWDWDIHYGSLPGLRTSLFFPLFKKWGINSKQWHYTSACVKCGKCVRSCAVKNICMGTDGPEWGPNCLSCLACYHICPYHAVEYGRITKGKGQYIFPLRKLKESRDGRI